MYVSGSDVFTNLVQASNIDPSIYGLSALPTDASNPKSAVLGGGTLAAVRPDAKGDQLAAAVKWIDFFYEQPLVSKAGAIRNAKTLVASKQPVGVPALPVFDQAQYTLANTWIKSYINAPVKQMTGYTNNIYKLKLAPEPEASTQSVYHSLDAAVEAVLTTQNANIPQLLSDAQNAAQQAISAGS
jgi:hypothetical protein